MRLTQYCNRCNKYIVKNANYCWNCGVEIVSNSRRFETALPTVNDVQPMDKPIRASMMVNDNWQVLIARSGIVFSVVGAGLWFFGAPTPFGYATIPAAMIAMGPPIIQALADFRAAGPPKEIEPPKPEATTVRFEYVQQTDDGPQIEIDEIDSVIDRLDLSDIQAVAELVIPMEYGGKGENFSKRKCSLVGLSENKYYLLQAFFLGGGYAEYPNNIKKKGLRFTSKGKAMLAQAYTPHPA